MSARSPSPCRRVSPAPTTSSSSATPPAWSTKTATPPRTPAASPVDHRRQPGLQGHRHRPGLRAARPGPDDQLDRQERRRWHRHRQLDRPPLRLPGRPAQRRHRAWPTCATPATWSTNARPTPPPPQSTSPRDLADGHVTFIVVSDLYQEVFKPGSTGDGTGKSAAGHRHPCRPRRQRRHRPHHRHHRHPRHGQLDHRRPRRRRHWQHLVRCRLPSPPAIRWSGARFLGEVQESSPRRRCLPHGLARRHPAAGRRTRQLPLHRPSRRPRPDPARRRHRQRRVRFPHHHRRRPGHAGPDHHRADNHPVHRPALRQHHHRRLERRQRGRRRR